AFALGLERRHPRHARLQPRHPGAPSHAFQRGLGHEGCEAAAAAALEPCLFRLALVFGGHLDAGERARRLLVRVLVGQH
ncbi:unnamed protein product, partial [Durusdinium trenchii]